MASAALFSFLSLEVPFGMACFFPVTLRARQGGGGTFSVRDSWLDRPDLVVPCKACVGCLLAYRRQWGIRCLLEKQTRDRACFVTLTYSDEHYPEDGSVSVRPMQLAMKRLRKHFPPGSLSYFLSGEYGSLNWRAHYHLVLFGTDFADDRELWRDAGGRRSYRSALLEKVWPYGHSEFSDVTLQSAQYVAGYTSKKQHRLVEATADDCFYLRPQPVTGELVLLQPEFVSMSTSPAIGREWLSRFRSDVYPSDFLVIDGQKYGLPKYFDRKHAEGILAPYSPFDDEAFLAEAFAEPDATAGAIFKRLAEAKAAHVAARPFLMPPAAEADVNALRVRRARAALSRSADNTPERIAARHEHAVITRFNRLERNL